MGIVVTEKLRRTFQITGCVGLAFFISSCATARVEMADAQFTKTAIAAEKTAVGPVVQIGGEPIRTHEAEAIRNQLVKAIGTKRNYIRVSSASGPNLIHRTGGTAESGITHSMRSAAKKNGVRYLLVTEITDNEVSRDIGQNCVDETEDIVDECGKVIGHRHISTTFTTTSQSTRKVAARFKMLDLEKGKTVWVSRSDSANTTSNSSDSCFSFPPPPPFPAPPKADGIGMTIARAAVRKLPRGGI